MEPLSGPHRCPKVLGYRTRKSAIDRGQQDLEWLRADLRREFPVALAALSAHELQEDWCNIFDPPFELALARIVGLVSKGVNVAVCSNTDPIHWSYLTKIAPELNSEKIARFLSFELRHTKAEKEFFGKVIELTGSPPEDHLLVDDLDSNLTVARECGLHMITARAGFPYAEVEDFITRKMWANG